MFTTMIPVSQLNVGMRICARESAAKWAVACEVSEDVLDVLSLNSISYIRIPPGIVTK